MTQVNKIDSNVTGLRYAEELSLKVLPGSPVWHQLEPNSYADFGGEITTLARNPINASRQRKKGVVSDLDAAGGFNNDLTQSNLQDLLQGFFFADMRVKEDFGGASEITNVDGTGETYDAASGLDAYEVGDLVHATIFDDTENNGLKRVTVATATNLTVAENLVDDASPATGATLARVGFQFTAGDLDVDASGPLPVLNSTTKDLTELGLIPGEWIFIGGDSALLAYTNPENNGFARVRSVVTNQIVLDKTDSTMVTEASTSETIQIFLPRTLKNELGTLIKRRSYQLERQLGAPDDAAPADIQAEYLVGGIPNEATINVAQADKINIDLSFVALDEETIDGPTALKTGTRPSLEEADAFNTSSDFSRIRLAVVDQTDAAPTPLFAFVEELNLSINNNVQPNKAVAVLGAFDASAGQFEVGGSLTAYFADITAKASVRNNADITLDVAIVKNNAGIVIDVPLLTLGDGRANVEQDEAIKIPLSQEAATGAKIDSNLDYTLMMCFFDYLPTLADV